VTILAFVIAAFILVPPVLMVWLSYEEVEKK
jgi:hypothetical protein